MSRLVQITVTTPTGTLWVQRYGFNAAGERVLTLIAPAAQSATPTIPTQPDVIS
jgi:hypothetical protein